MAMAFGKFYMGKRVIIKMYVVILNGKNEIYMKREKESWRSGKRGPQGLELFSNS